MSINIDENIVPRWLPMYGGQKINDLQEADTYKCVLAWNYTIDMLSQHTVSPIPSTSDSSTRTPLHLFFHESTKFVLWRYHDTFINKMLLFKRRWAPSAKNKRFHTAIDDGLMEQCKQLFTGQQQLTSEQIVAVEQHVQQELLVHPTIQSTLPPEPVKAARTDPSAAAKTSKTAATKAPQATAADNEASATEADAEDGDYPAGRGFVPTWMHRIGGKDVAELTEAELMPFVQQWNTSLTWDSNSSEPVDRASKWHLGSRLETEMSLQQRVAKVLQRLAQWQSDTHANQHLLPSPLQQGFTPTTEQSNRLAAVFNTVTTTDLPASATPHHPHGKHTIPHFIPLFGDLDVADLTLADIKYMMQRWNEDAATNLPQFKLLVMPVKHDATLREAIDVVALWLHRLYEVRSDPEQLAKLPARMRPVDLNESSAAQRQNRQQKAEKAKQKAAVTALAAAPTKSSAAPPKADATKKPGDSKPKAPGANGGNAAAKPTQPQYEVRANPSKRLFRAQHVVEGWVHNPIYSPNTDANPSDYLGYNARDVYRVVKVIFRHLHKHKASRIDWTKVSADYLSTYAKVIPESECKLLWRYVAYRTRPNGSIERSTLR